MKFFLLISTLLLGTSAFAQDQAAEDKTVLLVNDVPIKQSTLVQYHVSKDYKNSENLQQQKAQQLKSAQELINIYLLSEEAEKNGLHTDYLVKQSLELARRTVLMAAMVEKYTAEITVSEKELEEVYTLINKNAHEKADFKISTIVVDQENTAREIIAKLKSGESFEQLAKKHAPEGFKEAKSSEWMNSSMVQPEIAAAIATLKKTEFTSEPVKTQFGWHVIYLQDKKTVEVPPLNKIKSKLTGLVKKKKLSDKVQELRAKASVKTTNKTE